MTETVQHSTSTLTAQQLGQELRSRREQLGYSIGEAAERLKLPARQIESMETGNYEGMPETVFVRGFLRSYGRFLQIDDNTLNHYLEQVHPFPKVERNISHNSDYRPAPERKGFPAWGYVLAALVVIGGGVYAWQQKSVSETAKQEAEQENSAATASLPSNLNSDNIVIKPMTASDDTIGQSQTASAPAVANGELLINARYRTMLTVRNANGEVLISQIVPARSEHRFSEGAPFEVRMGWAVGSSATFNGETININRYLRGKSAEFTVGGDAAASAPQP